MKDPLVTVVCLCYNQAAYVKDAIQSILDQTYPFIEIIVVDDASTDESIDAIKSLLKSYSSIQFIKLSTNQGNCRAFNKALKVAKGKYIIDLAADDLLHKERVATGVKALEKLDDGWAVHYCDARIIDANSIEVSPNDHNQIRKSGDLFNDLIRRYFINPATTMFRTETLRNLGGYDTQLSYEDFDIWIRIAREHQFVYTPEVLITKRIVGKSLSSQQFKILNRHQKSTLVVCQKIKKLIASASERKALNDRVRYEIRNCIRYFNWHLIPDFMRLLK